MKVVLHGFGSFPVIFYHVIEYARVAFPEVEWGIVLTTDHYRSLFQQLLGKENVCVLGDGFGAQDDAAIDSVYSGNLFQDIEAEKRTLKHRSGETQCSIALSRYSTILGFFKAFSPNVALVSQLEGLDGKIFIAAARNMAVEVVVPTSCRNVGGVYFSPDEIESFPSYATSDNLKCRELAVEFVRSFRLAPTSAVAPIVASNDELLPNFVPPLPVRAAGAMRRWFRAGSGMEFDSLRMAFLNNLPLLRNAIWRVRKSVNQRYFDISKISELPEKFVFYPLQYSPESSINTPAPYYVDQLRAVDAIRYSLPSNYRLVVKEHPSCILVRPSTLVRKLQKTAGVVVAHYRMSTPEIIRKASLTISVTGTATFEAFLHGKSALVLGGCLSSNLLGGICSVDGLAQRMAAALDSSIADETVIDSLTRLFSIRHQCVFSSPGIPGEPVLRRENLQRFADGFMDHCQRLMKRDLN